MHVVLRLIEKKIELIKPTSGEKYPRANPKISKQPHAAASFVFEIQSQNFAFIGRGLHFLCTAPQRHLHFVRLTMTAFKTLIRRVRQSGNTTTGRPSTGPAPLLEPAKVLESDDPSPAANAQPETNLHELHSGGTVYNTLPF